LKLILLSRLQNQINCHACQICRRSNMPATCQIHQLSTSFRKLSGLNYWIEWFGKWNNNLYLKTLNYVLVMDNDWFFSLFPWFINKIQVTRMITSFSKQIPFQFSFIFFSKSTNKFPEKKFCPCNYNLRKLHKNVYLPQREATRWLHYQ
jgi:hypothetical protein